MGASRRRCRAALGGLLLLLGCGGCMPPPEVVRPDELRATVPGARAVVVVYSRTGHTAKMARAFAKVLGADYVRLQGSGEEGGSWFSTPSWKDQVALTPEQVALEPYQLVLVGGPVWYWKPNALTGSFIRGSDLKGKDVVLFFTFEGGEMSAETEAQWKAFVAERGGKVIDLVGIDRKKLGRDVTVEQEAERIAEERRPTWRGSAP